MRRLEDLGIGGLKLVQDTDLFCFGTDSVLLSDFARALPSERVMDLCTGNGIIPILMSAKTKAKEIYGIEILDESYSLAVENAQINSLTDRIKFVHDDLKNWMEHFPSGHFDVVTCNPPYMKVGAGFKSAGDSKAAARHELFATLSDIISAAAGLLKFGGHFYIVHRADRLCDVLCTMRENKIEPKRLKFVQANPYKEPSLILVEGIKGANSSLKIEKTVYVNM